jgi:alginate O-acetyltransferase complex protein AlgJ
MMMLNEKAQLLVSVGFVYSLAAVGLSTHNLMDPVDGNHDVINGVRQSAYEAGFTKANPLNDVSIAAMGTFKYAVFGQAETGAIIGKNGWLFTSEEFEVSDNFLDNLSQSATEIARVSAIMKQKGIALIPVIVPDKSEAFADMLRTARPVEIETRRAHVMSLLAARNVAAIDALGAIKAAKTGFIKDDTHWSPTGSRAVAEFIAAHAAILDVDLTPATVTTTQGPAVDFDGDLLQFVPSGAFRAALGPAQNQIESYTTSVESAGGLFGETDIDVALIGTSFSAKPEWNFAGFLQDALGAEVLNFAIEGQGPFKPMQAYLASETFQNTPPKLVVWEIPARYTSKDMNQ